MMIGYFYHKEIKIKNDNINNKLLSTCKINCNYNDKCKNARFINDIE